ncbi:MAG: 30S ribosomal protein S6 [Planctomycetota bacterium]
MAVKRVEKMDQGVVEGQRLYEAMFLLSQGVAADLNGAIEHIDDLFSRANATVVAMKKWDERRLAYEIDKQKRGVYILAYFTGDSDAVASLDRDCNLSERIMRVLVTRADHMTQAEAEVHNDRDGLAAEARMRSDKAASADEERRSGVRVGKPEEELARERAEAEAKAAKAAEAAAATAEAEPESAPAEDDAEKPAE